MCLCLRTTIVGLCGFNHKPQTKCRYLINICIYNRHTFYDLTFLTYVDSNVQMLATVQTDDGSNGSCGSCGQNTGDTFHTTLSGYNTTTEVCNATSSDQNHASLLEAISFITQTEHLTFSKRLKPQWGVHYYSSFVTCWKYDIVIHV